MHWATRAALTAAVSLLAHAVAAYECHLDDCTSMLQVSSRLTASWNSRAPVELYARGAVAAGTNRTSVDTMEHEVDKARILSVVKAALRQGANLEDSSMWFNAARSAFGRYWRDFDVAAGTLQRDMLINASYKEQLGQLGSTGKYQDALADYKAAHLLQFWRNLWNSGYDPRVVHAAYDEWMRDLEIKWGNDEDKRRVVGANAQQAAVMKQAIAQGAAQAKAAEQAQAKGGAATTAAPR